MGHSLGDTTNNDESCGPSTSPTARLRMAGLRIVSGSLALIVAVFLFLMSRTERKTANLNTRLLSALEGAGVVPSSDAEENGGSTCVATECSKRLC